MSNTTNTKNERVVTLGKIKNHDCGMPIVEVLVNGKCRGYLSPFRKYCFQVSNTFNGEGCMASSRVIGLKKIATFTSNEREPSNENIHGIRRELMMGQAMIALADFAYRSDAVLDMETLAETQPEFWYRYTILHEFIDRTIEYLNPTEHTDADAL